MILGLQSLRFAAFVHEPLPSGLTWSHVQCINMARELDRHGWVQIESIDKCRFEDCRGDMVRLRSMIHHRTALGAICRVHADLKFPEEEMEYYTRVELVEGPFLVSHMVYRHMFREGTLSLFTRSMPDKLDLDILVCRSCECYFISIVEVP